MNWISLQDINFKLFEFYKIRNKGFSSLELKHMVYAHAKFGGPIAITSDPDAFIMGNDANNDAIKNICIFRNDGNLLRRISKEGMPKIVGMDFLDEEYLLVITQEGSYILVDPHKGTKRSYRLDSRFMAEPIIEAKVVGNSVIFYTGLQGSFKFYFVRNIFTPNCEPFSHGEIKTKPAFFLPVSPKCSLSERLECLVTHSSAGIHRLVEDQDEMILFNPANASSAFLAQLPTIKEIKLIAMSPSNDIEKQMIAFLTKDNNLFVVSSDFTKILMTKDEVSKDLKDSKGWKKAVKLMWCGEDAVVLFVGRTIHLITEHNIVEKEIKNTKALLPMQEIDGIKITSSNKCEILRALPPYYVNIFKINSSAKAKDLYEAYEDYEQRQASYENNILTEKKGLQEAVEECVEAACFELNITEQLKLLRAAHFGKTFLNPNNSTFDHNKFSHACKILRVISAFRSDGFDGLARSLTYAQFQGLSELQVTRILVRYQLYYVADEICKFLGYSPKLISQVCVNWACAKIESTHEAGEGSEQQQENLANIIYEKLKNESTISFAEIARKAVEIGKDHLARKLLDKEKSFSKKLQVLLEMKDYLSSLREAIYSRDPNLIEMVIFKMQRDNLPEQSVWTLLSKTPLSKKLLLEYLKNFKPESLNVYMMDHSTGDERAFYAIKNAYNIKDLPQRMAVIQDFALKFFEDKFAKDMTKEHYQYLSHLIKENGIKSDEVPINTHLETLFKEGKFEKAEKVRKEFKISDRNFYTVKAKCFINEKKWEELDALLSDKNKKSQTIPWFVVIDLLSEKSEYDLVEKYVVRLPDVDEQIAILKMINRFAAAVDVAYKNKRGEALEEMENHPAIDQKTRDTIDSMLISLRRR